MRKLSKAQATEFDARIAALRARAEEVENAYSAFEDAHGELAAAVEAYNEAVSEAESFRDEIVGEMQTYYDDRSEKRQEGDAGSNYQDWINEWENFDLTHLDEPDLPYRPECAHADELENLPQEVST